MFNPPVETNGMPLWARCVYQVVMGLVFATAIPLVAMANSAPTTSEALLSLLEQSTQGIATGKVSTKSESQQVEEEQPPARARAPKRRTPLREFLDSSDSNGPLSTEEYYERLEAILSQIDKETDLEMMYRQLVADGVLDMSLRDIRLLRMAIEARDKIENQPLVDVTSNHAVYNVTPNQRYQTYEVTVNRNGTTLLEFLDATGQAWPVNDHSDSPDFILKAGSRSHFMEVQSNRPYGENSVFLFLDQYESPLMIDLSYSRDQRHSIVTFRLPFIHPDNLPESEHGERNTDGLTGIVPVSTATQGDEVEQVSYEELTYFATTGYWPIDGAASSKANKVLVSAPELAEVWRVGSQFVIRSRHIPVIDWDEMHPAPNGVRVYVAKSLNTSILMHVEGGDTRQLLIPDYHLYGGL
ncbi:DotH/IcmK family type IV secretion protein [Aliagarivorans taiwanensis]|uniref:DotH/IcmK family type IV secretion protein n=1 Tax=Aliagarivorans taiwanensis TaxID=561966 RepID=UPI00047DDCE9|nr:DotH/IcmK family type IV secretion protein [Aliagarivorans taiwanensis]